MVKKASSCQPNSAKVPLRYHFWSLLCKNRTRRSSPNCRFFVNPSMNGSFRPRAVRVLFHNRVSLNSCFCTPQIEMHTRANSKNKRPVTIKRLWNALFVFRSCIAACQIQTLPSKLIKYDQCPNYFSRLSPTCGSSFRTLPTTLEKVEKLVQKAAVKSDRPGG